LTGTVASGASRGVASKLSDYVTEVRSASDVPRLGGFITTIHPASSCGTVTSTKSWITSSQVSSCIP
jgi:hypothetical protein